MDEPGFELDGGQIEGTDEINVDKRARSKVSQAGFKLHSFRNLTSHWLNLQCLRLQQSEEGQRRLSCWKDIWIHSCPFTTKQC